MCSHSFAAPHELADPLHLPCGDSGCSSRLTADVSALRCYWIAAIIHTGLIYCLTPTAGWGGNTCVFTVRGRQCKSVIEDSSDCIAFWGVTSCSLVGRWQHFSVWLLNNMKISTYKTVMLPVVLYGCETWCCHYEVGTGWGVRENRVLGDVLCLGLREEVTGEWRKVHSEELQICTVRAMTQAVTSEASVWSQVRPCGILGGQCGSVTGFCSVTSFPPVSTIPPMLRRHLHLDTSLDEKDNR